MLYTKIYVNRVKIEDLHKTFVKILNRGIFAKLAIFGPKMPKISQKHFRQPDFDLFFGVNL